MPLSTTFTECAPETTQLSIITQNKAISPFKVTDFGTNQKLIYDFLLVITTNLPPILHRFYDMASLYLATPLAFKLSTDGFPWDDLRKIFRGRRRMAKVANGEETLPKISTG